MGIKAAAKKYPLIFLRKDLLIMSENIKTD